MRTQLITTKDDNTGKVSQVKKRVLPPLSKTGVFRTNRVAVPKSGAPSTVGEGAPLDLSRPVHKIIQSHMKRCLAVDWLQLHVKMPFRDYHTIVKPTRYMISRQEGQTRNFKVLYTIIDNLDLSEVAVIAAEPRNTMCMNEDSGLIKICNKYLYQKNFSHFVRSILQDLQLTFINITRIDLAYDFERFDTMECRAFMERFADCTYLKQRQCKFKMMGDTWSVDRGQLTGGISSLKFGMETSDVNYYLYNKTLELAQVKHKPWIHEHWCANGWRGNTEVYRLEFSLRPDTRGILGVAQDGTLTEMYHFKDLSMIDQIEDIYRHYFNTHFNFVHTEITKKGNYKKQSRCEPVHLFEELKFASVHIKLSNKKDSGRSAKVFTKALMQLNQELRGQDFDLAIYGNELLTWVIQTRDIKEWAEKKLPGVHLSDRVVGIVQQGRTAHLRTAMAGINSLPTIYPTAEQQEKDYVQFVAYQQQEKKSKEDREVLHYSDDVETKTAMYYDANGNVVKKDYVPF